jgi:hypothetical protein
VRYIVIIAIYLNHEAAGPNSNGRKVMKAILRVEGILFGKYSI